MEIFKHQNQEINENQNVLWYIIYDCAGKRAYEGEINWRVEMVILQSSGQLVNKEQWKISVFCMKVVWKEKVDAPCAGPL